MTRLTFVHAVLVFGMVICRFGILNQTEMPASAAEIEPKAIDADVFARQVIAITDLVLRHDIDPPTRQEMILSGARSLLKKSGQSVPVGLARRISALGQTDELQRFLKTLWLTANEARSGSAEDLQAAMFTGLLDSIPGSPQIIPPSAFKVAKQTNSNRYVGIGIQLTIDRHNRWATIRTPLAGGPAQQAGAKAGDRILEVDGQSTKGLTLRQVVALLRGDEGTNVTVVVRQPNDTKQRRLTMTRGVIPFQSILGYRRMAAGEWDFRVSRSHPIAYLAIPVIRISSVHELRQTARLLQADGIRAVVIDLRFCSAAAELRHAVFLADELLANGKIGCVLNSDGTKQNFEAEPDSLFTGWPIVVLVNQYTTAEAEFVAAALQDNGRATIVGERTAGRGYSRSLFELPYRLGGLMLRTSLMTRADGRPLQRPLLQAASSTRVVFVPPGNRSASVARSADWGVTPDAENVVKVSKQQLRKLLTFRSEQQVIGRPDKSKLPTPHDPQLERAMEILQAQISQQNEKSE